MANTAPIKTALLSVSDKTGLEHFARGLAGHGVKLLSTGGTAAALRNMGLAVTDVSDVTGFPEILDGRVKTLHPSVHGALLAVRGNAEHEKARAENGIGMIDLLVVNLYPFEQTLAKGAARDEMIENIDVGGPAMIRGAAKNHNDVTVVVDPADYDGVLSELAASNGTSLALRRRLAAKAFARTATYDAAISRWMADDTGETFPAFFAIGGKLHQSLRYGENPHQKAAAYAVQDGRIGVLAARQMQGKELSYNNINDADAALEAISEFDGGRQAACVIVKHANPCGVAIAGSLREAYLKALSCDATSAFGGILAFNRKLDGKTADEIAKLFTEVIIAPDADEDAKAVLAAKKNLRLLLLPRMPDPAGSGLFVKSIAGGMLVQTRDAVTLDEATLRIVSKRKPDDAEMQDLRFAWTVAKHVKSNAIVFARNGMTTGIGAGQMSRIDSTRIAVSKSLDAARCAGGIEAWAKGSVLASDAFFPFADGIEAAAQAGATAIIQPGGALRDDDVIRCADEHGLAMVFTGIRHFRH